MARKYLAEQGDSAESPKKFYSSHVNLLTNTRDLKTRFGSGARPSGLPLSS